jgi:hypothetical protein
MQWPTICFWSQCTSVPFRFSNLVSSFLKSTILILLWVSILNTSKCMSIFFPCHYTPCTHPHSSSSNSMVARRTTTARLLSAFGMPSPSPSIVWLITNSQARGWIAPTSWQAAMDAQEIGGSLYKVRIVVIFHLVSFTCPSSIFCSCPLPFSFSPIFPLPNSPSVEHGAYRDIVCPLLIYA